MISDGDATILLNAIVLNERIHRLATERLDDPIFDPATQFSHDFIMKQFTDISDEAGEHAPLSLLGARLADALSEMGPSEEEWAVEINDLFQNIKENRNEPIGEKYVIDLMQLISNEQSQRGVEELLATMMDRESPEMFQSKMGDTVNKYLREKRIVGGVESSYVQPLKSLEDMMISSKAWPIGVDFFDEMLGGGLRTGKLWGFLGPPSGGKTLLSVQLGMNWVKQSPEHHTLLMTYEQPIKGELTERILSQTTGKDVGIFRDKRMDQLSEELRKEIFDKSVSYADRLHVFDFSQPGQGTHGLEDIKEAIEMLGLMLETESVDTEHTPPLFVIVDWLIPLFQRNMTEDGMLAVGSDLRGFGTKLMDEIKAFKNKYNVTFLINHQLSPKAANSSAVRTPQLGDAAEWSGFAWMLDDCFGVGPRTEDDIAIMVAAKTRATARSKIFVKLDGAFCRFVDVTNDYMVTNGRMTKKTMQTVRGSSTKRQVANLLPKSVASETRGQFKQ